jgi:hypothetical protein
MPRIFDNIKTRFLPTLQETIFLNDTSRRPGRMDQNHSSEV